jgi:hypothetical protein
MAAGAIIGAAAAAAAAREQANVLQRFRLADATAPDRAQSLDSLGLRPEGLVARLMAAGVILPGSRANRVYLSEAALLAYEQQTVKRSRLIAAVLACIALAVGTGVAAFAILQTHTVGR